MAVYSNKHEKGSLLIVDSDSSNEELKSEFNVDTHLPNVENISWCGNGILFSYSDRLVSIGSGDDGSGAVRMQIGNMQDEGIYC